MAQFILTYHVTEGKSAGLSPEEGKAGQQKFMQWAQSIADVTVTPNTPCMKTHSVEDGDVREGGGPNTMMGFTIIDVESLEAALEIAKSCPHQTMMGPVQVAQCMQMPG